MKRTGDKDIFERGIIKAVRFTAKLTIHFDYALLKEEFFSFNLTEIG